MDWLREAHADLHRRFSNSVRSKVASNRNRVEYKGHDLDLSYITPRLIAMAFPSEGVAATWRNDVAIVEQFLSEHHPQSFHVWNLDVAFYNPELLQGRVTHCGWPDHHAPLLPHLCAIVDQMAEFLAASVNNVCVVHCLAGKGRSGTVCSAFLARTQAMSASDALAAFGVARCVDGSGVAQPSQIRYVHYVHLMDRLGVLRPPERRVLLVRVDVSHAPNFDGEGCMPLLEVERDWTPVFSRAAQHRAFTDNPIEFVLPEGGLELAGDVCLRMHAVRSSVVGSTRVAMLRCQFNTAYVDQEVLCTVDAPRGIAIFGLAQLDDAQEKPLTSYQHYNSAMRLLLTFRVLH